MIGQTCRYAKWRTQNCGAMLSRTPAMTTPEGASLSIPRVWPAQRLSRPEIDTHPILADEPSPAPWVGLGREREGRETHGGHAGDLAQSQRALQC